MISFVSNSLHDGFDDPDVNDRLNDPDIHDVMMTVMTVFLEGLDDCDVCGVHDGRVVCVFFHA